MGTAPGTFVDPLFTHGETVIGQLDLTYPVATAPTADVSQKVMIRV